MGKILVDVDEEMLAAAQAIFGTKTKKDTVNLALAEVVARVSRLKALEEGSNSSRVVSSILCWTSATTGPCRKGMIRFRAKKK